MSETVSIAERVVSCKIIDFRIIIWALIGWGYDSFSHSLNYMGVDKLKLYAQLGDLFNNENQQS